MTPREQTEALFARAGLLQHLAPDFIDWHLADGKTPDQIFQIATRSAPESWCRICAMTNGEHAEGCANDRNYAV